MRVIRSSERRRGTAGRTRVQSVTLAALIAAATMPHAAAAQDVEPAPLSPAPLSVEEVVEFRSLPVNSRIRISPDGRRAAWTIEGPRRTVGAVRPLLDPAGDAWTAIQVVDLERGETVTIPGGDREEGRTASAWSPSWSPDGRRLAYHADSGDGPRLFVWDTRTGRSRVVSDEILWSAWLWNAPRWTPDGRSLVVKLLPEDIEPAEMWRRGDAAPSTAGPTPDSITVEVFRAGPGAGETGRERATDEEGPGFEVAAWAAARFGGDLSVVDVETGRVRRLVTGAALLWWGVDPAGGRVAFTRMVPAARGPMPAFRVGVADLDAGPDTSVIDLPGTIRSSWGQSVSWSPDGGRLAYATVGDGDDGGLFVVDVDGRTRRRMADLRSGWILDHRGPSWSPDGAALFLAGERQGAGPERVVWRVEVDGAAARALPVGELEVRSIVGVTASEGRGERVLVTVEEGGRVGLAEVDPAAGLVRTGPLETGSFGRAVGPTAGRVLTLFSDERSAPEIWRLDEGLARAERVSRINPGFAPERLGGTRRVEWVLDDGTPADGTLWMPPEHVREAGPLPLIVKVYGGDDGAARLHSFDRHMQLLASRGFAVLVPDVPLSVGAPQEDHARAVRPAVRRVVELGIADPDRVGVTGHSYGGYGTLALLVETDLFAAAVVSQGHADMTGMFGRFQAGGVPSTHWAERGQGRMGGTPWSVPERYVRNSPLYRLDRVRAPVLLLHGAADENTPVHLAEAVFAGLQRLDRTVTLARYSGEPHWWGSWSVPNQIDYWARLTAWFDRHLGPR